MSRHLLLSCSDKKDLRPQPLPALQRYTGVAYKVLQRYIKEGGEQPVVWIISAKYGLIRSVDLVPHYDLKMTSAIAKTQREENIRLFERYLADRPPKELGVFLGEVYSGSIEPLEQILRGTKIVRFKGPIGKMLQQLKVWLNEVPPGAVKDFEMI